ncbi:MAG: hypothetical protein LBL07_05350 [Tannerella sp.]|jgi:hypothetical protein|nr:hypothetical protein [Tannerella sp.]
MKKVKRIFKNVRFWALLLLISSEVSLIIFFRNHFYQYISVWETTLLIPSVVLMVFLAWNRTGFSIKQKTVAKLLASVIQPRHSTIVYLFLFILHITCLGNAAYNFSTGNVSGTDILVFLIILTGCILLIYTFPDAPKKGTDKKKIFISGISNIFFNKDNKKISPTYGQYVIEQANLYPVVRAFHVTHNTNIKLKEGDILHILLTDNIDREYISKLEGAISTIEEFVNDKNINSEKSDSVKWFNDNFKKMDLTKDITTIITEYIRLFAKYAFYDNETLLSVIEKLDIRYSKAIDYNNFKDCYDTANSVLETYPIENNDIVINSTPGTVTLSSALSILSMADNRRLIYYNQNNDIPINNRMMEIAENKLEFKELIEQVAEDLSN